ncbi:hypothetical protein C8F01DRAFT_1370058 [Mycena amicta]|nr:hypothetical protein C8F01DRAFT_1370058 [Mycena amicta]
MESEKAISEQIIDVPASNEGTASGASPTLSPLDELESEYEDSEAGGDEGNMQDMLENPSTDIQADFNAAIHGGFAFNGPFSLFHRYTITDAPNPCLEIDGLGLVGCPLSDREARAIVAESVLVKTALATWEIPADKIHFSNPSWNNWILATVGDAVAKGLGISTSIAPTFALRKLVMHGPNSAVVQFKESLIREGDDNLKIGDMVVVLPSNFEDATIQLRYADRTNTHNLADQSRLSTSIVAAYSGVEHLMSSVSSGYMLSLVYDIIRPSTEGVRPALPDPAFPGEQLRHVLSSWKNNAQNAPPYLKYQFRHQKYEWAPNFRATSLTGHDALFVSHFRAIALELKFRLRFVRVVCTVKTPARATGQHLSSKNKGPIIDEAEFEDDATQSEQSVAVTEITDLNGIAYRVVNGSLTLGGFVHGQPDSVLFERKNRKNGIRTRVYNHIALLIWPRNTNVDRAVVVGDVYDYALDLLLSSSSPLAPTAKETKIIRRLLACCRIHRRRDMIHQVVQVLTQLTVRWMEPEMFLSMLSACWFCIDTDFLEGDEFISACRAFGWAALRKFWADIMKNDRSNLRRWSLLERLKNLGEAGNNSEMTRWCEEQAYTTVLDRLGPVGVEQIPWLISIAVQDGGSYFLHRIYPQLLRQKLHPWMFWLPFTNQLNQSTERISSPQAVRDIIVHWVSTLVNYPTPFPTSTPDEAMYPEATLDILKLCIETKNEHMCTSVFDKMQSASRTGEYPAPYPPWRYYLALVPPVVDLLQSRSDALVDNFFRPFFMHAVSAIVSQARRPVGAFSNADPALWPLDEQNQGILLVAARRVNSSYFLAQCFNAENFGRSLQHESKTLQYLALLLAKEFPRETVEDVHEYRGYVQIILDLASSAIETNVFICLMPFFPLEFKRRDLLYRCFRDLRSSKLISAEHACKDFGPFLHNLDQFLRERSLSLQEWPFDGFAASVIKLFAGKVMTEQPKDTISVAELRMVGCNVCPECRSLRQFLLSETAETTLSFCRTKAIRTHVEGQLRGCRVHGVEWVTINRGSPRTLKITRPARFALLGKWAALSTRGNALMSLVGDATVQKIVLGEDYEVVYERIHGVKPKPLPLPLSDGSQTLNVAQGKRPAASDAQAGPGPAKKLKMNSE